MVILYRLGTCDTKLKEVNIVAERKWFVDHVSTVEFGYNVFTVRNLCNLHRFDRHGVLADRDGVANNSLVIPLCAQRDRSGQFHSWQAPSVSVNEFFVARLNRRRFFSCLMEAQIYEETT